MLQSNSQNSVRQKSFGGRFTFSNCHIIGLDTGSLVLFVFDYIQEEEEEGDIHSKVTWLPPI
jgi:hypothetical protein